MITYTIDFIYRISILEKKIVNETRSIKWKFKVNNFIFKFNNSIKYIFLINKKVEALKKFEFFTLDDVAFSFEKVTSKDSLKKFK